VTPFDMGGSVFYSLNGNRGTSSLSVAAGT
jgi:hypothetical protein